MTNPVLFDEVALPERSRCIVEDLALDLLTSKACALVLLKDLGEEGLGEVVRVVVGTPTRDDRVRVLDHRPNQRRRPWRGCDARLGVRAKSEPEKKIIPRLGVSPCGDFVHPSGVVLRASQQVWLV